MEVERMEKIHRGDGFAIIEKDEEYQISWAQGPYNEPVFYPIQTKYGKKRLNQVKTHMK